MAMMVAFHGIKMSFYINPEMLKASDAQRLRLFAMDMLARRNHSRFELMQKMQARGADAALVAEVLAKLCAEHLLDDRWFIESCINEAVRKGQGERKLRYKLAQHQLDPDLIQEVLAASPVDWQQLAQRVYRQKFPQPLKGQDVREYNRRQRFMYSRGFVDFRIEDA